MYRSFDRMEEQRRYIYEQRRRKKRRQSIISTLRTTLLILLLLCFVFAFGVMMYSRDMTGEQVIMAVENGGEAQSLAFGEDKYYLSGGMSMQLHLITVPANVTTQVVWSSDDPSVAVVDTNGNVTAVGGGQAAITASGNGITAYTSVIVTDDVAAAAKDAVCRLASDASAYEDVKLYSAMLSPDDEIYSLVDMILGLSALDDARLAEYASRCDIDPDTAQMAALVGKLKRSSNDSAAVLSFAGDVTLARFNEDGTSEHFPQVYENSGSYTYPFDRVKGIFGCDDLTTVNFEGALTNSSVHKNKQFYFRGAPAYAGILTASGIECADLENNHSSDYYALGLKETKRFLSGAGVSVFNAAEPLSLTLSTVSGPINVIMLGYMWASGDAPPQSSLDALYSQIRQYSGVQNVVVVNCHWGREGSTVPAAWQRTAAHMMIDCGADIVVGHHSHVVQGVEQYKGHYIAYSLGNFAFGGNKTASNPESMILRAHITVGDEGITVRSIEIIPCLSTSSGGRENNYQPIPCFGDEGERVMKVINERSVF